MRASKAHSDAAATFLWGQVVLVGVLAAGAALFVSDPELRAAYELPSLGLVLSTLYAVGGGLVALLTATRFSVEGRRFDLLLSVGFSVISLSWVVFRLVPEVGERPVGGLEIWANLAGLLVGWGVIAAAPLAQGRVDRRVPALLAAFAGVVAVLFGIALILHLTGASLPRPDSGLRDAGFSQLALLNLLAAIGYGDRFRTQGEDLDRWLSLGGTLALFSSLAFLLGPTIDPGQVGQGDFLRLLADVVIVVGVWRAIRGSEFGRAVAEERARVARDIHDGLSQYLFAVSTHAAMLEAGSDPAVTIPRLKEAARAAQSEARFAVLALSSASGSAPFDTALRRYVDFISADGDLDVELDIDPAVRLAPDEQIEVFRIVQEGLANARRHAGARRAWVRLGRRGLERRLEVRDDGKGFDEPSVEGGHGLRNMRGRTEAIGGTFALRSAPGNGTALEVLLRS